MFPLIYSVVGSILGTNRVAIMVIVTYLQSLSHGYVFLQGSGIYYEINIVNMKSVGQSTDCSKALIKNPPKHYAMGDMTLDGGGGV